MPVDRGYLLGQLRQSRRTAWNGMLNTINDLSPATAAQLLYFRRTGKYLNLKRPTDFNEKLQWLKIYWDDPLKAICADKYQVYHYVASQGCDHILNRLLAVYESPDEIIWDELPEKFALKCTHGCKYNIVTRNKHELDPEAVRQQLWQWMGERFGRKSLEPHYDRITPRIILEAYIETPSGLLPWDYKIFCFNGKAKLVEVCSEREQGLRVDFFDLDWNTLPISLEELRRDTPPEPPACLPEMLACAEKLAKPFPFVRVDLYDNEGTPMLGELTFTPNSSMSTRLNEEGLRYLGDLLTLPDAPLDDSSPSIPDAANRPLADKPLTNTPLTNTPLSDPSRSRQAGEG
ncbi:ATP-grasp fold amidoligase family protein [Halomonas sp. CKK8]|uniref:ATP-grasp fold amidoligase family protein n=1 Tax=Halomonas sp. CKK8 TaxID=3036127 RepID=UPI002414D307|nr:ATP-grasp fold amidoligase family protein [Halomonas sp. CKK8]WFM70016.1 ATP-grasp fold amidoligase family protein [Halomonas sp. CKK8]